MIEGQPAVDLIQQYDAPDVLFYCHPPPADGRPVNEEMTDADHIEMLERSWPAEARSS